jgi:uncharacterized protein YdaU (DUF1376 family)
MSAKADIYMPVFLGDYQKHTKRLTTEQHGCYFLLMQDYWINGPPPDDDSVLARITGCSEHSWSTNRAALEQFFRVADGVWRQKRIDEELEKAANRKEKASIAAKAKQDKLRAQIQAEARAKTKPKKGAPSTLQAPAQGVLHGCPSTSTTVEEASYKASSHSGRKATLSPHEGQATPAPGKEKDPAFRAAEAERARQALGIKPKGRRSNPP